MAVSGLNVADMLSALNNTKGKEMDEDELKVEQMLAKLKRLQKDQRVLEEECKEIQTVGESLHKELEALNTESYELKGILKEKEELFLKLQYQVEDSEKEVARAMELNKSAQERSEQSKCEIQATKLKHRKLRMKFENQLCQLIEQQKNLCMFMPDRLPAEIEIAEKTKEQLLAAEKVKIAQLRFLEEEIEKVKQQKQGALTVVQED